MPPPDYGYGPANYANQGNEDPFAAFDNRINYNEMLRHQMVSQYQRSVVRPATMTLSQAREVATQQRFQYGVQGGQDPRMYERNAALSRAAFGSSLGSGVADIGMWGAAEAGAGALGAGFIGSMAIPLAATIAPMYFLNRGVKKSLDRRKYMHSIAADVEQYRGQLGFASGEMSYNNATELGRRLESSMSAPGQFFSREQQSRIHKIGLSNDLLSARGGGVDSGSIKQYEKNVKELISTTEDVVKLLQTTTEGGMSVIKELKQKGFGSMKEIRDQVIRAKAFGGMTGLGSQNMMQIGAAGAQAVQGTSWSASAGAGMYQYGAAQAHMMAQASPGAAYAVKRAGGTAAAGAAIGNFAMNMMSSGIGTKLAAYAMKPNGDVDPGRMERMLSGKAGAYEVVTGANNTGYNMGEDRVRFGMFKEDMLNQMKPQDQMRMVNAGFAAWSKQRPYSSAKNLAYVFAGQFSNDKREQRLMYEQLMGNKGYAQMEAANQAEMIGLNQFQSKRRLGATGRAIRGGYKAFTGFFNDAAESLVSTSEDLVTGGVDAWGAVKSELGRGAEKALQGLGIWDEYGRINRAEYGDVGDAARRAYGLVKTSKASRMAFDMASAADIKSLTVAPKAGVETNLLGMIGRVGVGETNYAVQKLWQSQVEGTPGEAYKDPIVLAALGVDPSKIGKDQFAGLTAATLGGLRKEVSAVSRAHDDAKSEFDKRFPVDSKERASVMPQIEAGRRAMTLNGGSIGHRTDVGVGQLEKVTNMSRRGFKSTEMYVTADPSGYDRETNKIIKNYQLAESEMRKVGSIDLGPKTEITTTGAAEKAADAAISKVFGPTYVRRKKTRVSTIAGSIETGEMVGVASEEWLVKKAEFKDLGVDIGTKAGRKDLFEQMLGFEARVTGDYKAGDVLNENELKKYNLAIDMFGTTKAGGKQETADAASALRISQAAPEVTRRRGMVSSAMGMLKKEGFLADEDKALEFKDLYEKSLGLAGPEGRLSGKGAKAFTREFETELGMVTGATRKVIDSHSKSASDFTGFMAQDAKMKALGTPTGKMNRLFEDMELIAKMREGKEFSGKIILDGNKETDVSVLEQSDESKEKMLDRADAALERRRNKMTMKLQIDSARETSQGGSASAFVKPPISNYWNNRWIL